MTDESKALTQPIKFGGRKIGIAAKRDAAIEKMRSIDPLTVQNRLVIVLDDSGSMAGSMGDAHNAVSGFLSTCNPLETSIATYPLNANAKSLSCDYSIVEAYVRGIGATGSTPLYSVLERALANEKLTRAVVFSDGVPTDDTGGFLSSRSDALGERANKVCEDYKAKEIPIDTVGIGNRSFGILEKIAERTGGIFLHFTDMSVFGKALKYLSPALRPMLMSPDVRKKVEKGEI